MITSILTDPALDMETIIRAYKQRETTLLVIKPSPDHESIAVRVQNYDYSTESFIVTHKDRASHTRQILHLSRRDQAWRLTPYWRAVVY